MVLNKLNLEFKHVRGSSNKAADFISHNECSITKTKKNN